MILKAIFLYLLLINAAAFVAYGVDKLKARRSWWRIPESTLLLMAALGGSLGAWMGMKVWHHKTMHKKFRYGVPLLVMLQVALAAFLLAGCTGGSGRVDEGRLQRRVDSLLAERQVDVGLAVLYRGEWLCEVGLDKQFPMMSVYKLHQAMVVRSLVVNSEHIRMYSEVPIFRDMLRPDTYSPLRDAYPEGDVRLSVEELLRYSLQLSDNNATDILFEQFGGPALVQKSMECLGLRDTRICWTEDDMHRDTSRAADNVTTPREAACLMETGYRDQWLRRTLMGCQTGQKRLPALLPEGVRVGHKTGTGDPLPNGMQSGVNDVGFVEVPGKEEPYFIAVFCNNAAMSLEQTEALIAELSLMVYEHVARLQ